MTLLIDVVLPIFLIVGFGYVAVWRGIISEGTVDALMSFAQKIAIPLLLFRAISTLDFSSGFQVPVLVGFYAGALICFCLGVSGAHFLFKRDWEDSIAVGFACLFSNSVLLGLPITERAYGPDNLTTNFAIIALHAPICYGVGITVMEVVKARGSSARSLPAKVLRAMFNNALILGIAAGIVANLSGLELPKAFAVSADLLAGAGLPTALFALGGVLFRYRPEGDLRIIAMICALSLLVHPALVFAFGSLADINQAAFRSMVLTSAMAPGINAYLFADMYGRARRVAASSVLIATGLTVVTAWGWLRLLA